MIPTATVSVICRALLPSSTISGTWAAMPCGSTPALIRRSRMRAMMCATTKDRPALRHERGRRRAVQGRACEGHPCTVRPGARPHERGTPVVQGQLQARAQRILGPLYLDGFLLCLRRRDAVHRRRDRTQRHVYPELLQVPARAELRLWKDQPEVAEAHRRPRLRGDGGGHEGRHAVLAGHGMRRLPRRYGVEPCKE